MIEVDKIISTALNDLNIQRFPCEIQADGLISVSEITKDRRIGCVVETIASTERLDTGLLRIESFFYFFSTMKKDQDVIDDLNPKILEIVFAVESFKKKLKSCSLNVGYPRKKNPTMRYRTTSYECGQELIITFDIQLPCSL